MILRLQHERPDGEIDAYFLKPGRRYHIGRGSSCEVRILDLKLSRKHCALECNDGRWHVVDLLSTNGCELNGEQIVGTIPVKKGQVISAGSTQLTIADIFDTETAPVQGTHSIAAKGTSEPQGEAETEAVNPDSESAELSAHVLEQEPLPEGPIDHASKTEALRRNEFDPEPVPAEMRKTAALVPLPGHTPKMESIASPIKEARAPTAVFRVDQDQPAPAQSEIKSTTAIVNSGTDSSERPFFITLLGRRIGPLSRAVARDLKARELKGTLTSADIEQYPSA
jgi:pSer/pThr/pTyr-binding forkhead associated (FHA) protein